MLNNFYVDHFQVLQIEDLFIEFPDELFIKTHPLIKFWKKFQLAPLRTLLY